MIRRIWRMRPSREGGTCALRCLRPGAYVRKIHFPEAANFIHCLGPSGEPLARGPVQGVRVLSQQPVSDLARGVSLFRVWPRVSAGMRIRTLFEGS